MKSSVQSTTIAAIGNLVGLPVGLAVGLLAGLPVVFVVFTLKPDLGGFDLGPLVWMINIVAMVAVPCALLVGAITSGLFLKRFNATAARETALILGLLNLAGIPLAAGCANCTLDPYGEPPIRTATLALAYLGLVAPTVARVLALRVVRDQSGQPEEIGPDELRVAQPSARRRAWTAALITVTCAISVEVATILLSGSLALDLEGSPFYQMVQAFVGAWLGGILGIAAAWWLLRRSALGESLMRFTRRAVVLAAGLTAAGLLVTEVISALPFPPLAWLDLGDIALLIVLVVTILAAVIAATERPVTKPGLPPMTGPEMPGA